MNRVLRVVLVLLLLGALWAVVLILALPLWAAIVPTAGALCAAIAVALLRRRRARRAAREIEAALRAQAAEQVSQAQPDQRGEIEAMQREFLKGIESLRASKLGKQGFDALYALPWYLIVGPPGAGKTTALRNSGLSFPHLTRESSGLRGAGGTRNCDWWLSNEAVILDTAGRYTDEGDRDEWLAFLDLLRRQRERCPINGVIVALGVDQLGEMDAAAIDATGRRLRERVDEVMERLEMSTPVYLLVTKCDLIPGFVETFGALTRAERAQIWGFTLPLEGAKAEVQAEFLARFDELAGATEAAAMRRAVEVRRVDQRERVFGFPAQMGALRENLAALCGAIFAESVFHSTPRLRGVYFTSGTQEGRPIDRVLGRMAAAFGFGSRGVAFEAVSEAKSYFLGDVFARVIFPDQGLAVRSASELRRRRRAQLLGAGALLGAAALLLLLPTFAYRSNAGLLARAEAATAEVEGYHRDQTEGKVPPLGLLEPLRRLAEELAGYEEAVPLTMSFGMYVGEALHGAANSLFAATLRGDLLRPALAADEADLRVLAARYADPSTRPTRKDFDAAHDRLKLHLLLTAGEVGVADGGPRLADPAVRRFVAQRVIEHWGGPGGHGLSREELEAIARNVDTFVDLADRGELGLLVRDPELVSEIRKILTRKPAVELMIERIIDTCTDQGLDLELRDITGSVAPWVLAERRVRGAFTREGWERVVRDQIASADLEAAEPWVLGLRPEEIEVRGTQLREALESLYFELYVREWRDFLDGITVASPVSRLEALVMLQDLTRGSLAPYARLFRAIDYNSRILYPEPPAEEGGDTLDKVAAAGEKALAGSKAKAAAPAAKAALARSRGPAKVERDPNDPRWIAEDVRATFSGLAIFGAAPRPTGADKDAAPPPPVELDIYLEQLVFLRDGLQSAIDDPEQVGELSTRLQAARTRVRAMIEGQQVGWRPRFEALLWPPLAGLSAAVSGDAAGSVSRRWCSEVVVPHDRGLAGRYPFDANAAQEVKLADFAEFFAPDGGTLWAFYGQALQRPVPREGDRFAFSRQLGRDLSEVFVPELPGFLTAARDLSSVTFPPGAKEPRVEIDVQIVPSPGIEEITLSVGPQSASHRNGPERWQRIVWPAEGDGAAAALEVRGAAFSEVIRQEGAWGLFRLLERGQIKGSADAGVFTVTWVFRDHGDLPVTVRIRPTRAESPFFGVPGRGGGPMSPFRAVGLTLPRRLALAGPGCPGGPSGKGAKDLSKKSGGGK